MRQSLKDLPNAPVFSKQIWDLISFEMVVQSLTSSLAMDLKLWCSLSKVSMRILASKFKCLCLFIMVSPYCWEEAPCLYKEL